MSKKKEKPGIKPDIKPKEPTDEDYKKLILLAQQTLLPMNLAITRIAKYHGIK